LHQKQSILGETKGGRHEKEKKREGVKDRRRKTQRTRERIGEQGEKKKQREHGRTGELKKTEEEEKKKLRGLDGKENGYKVKNKKTHRHGGCT
jgi:hypothetical protein